MSTTRKVFLKGTGIALGILLLFSLAVNAQTIYVTPSGAGTHSGSSWANAMGNTEFTTSLQTADHIEFWVKAGTYKPTTNTSDRSGTFKIGSGVVLFGGFAGTEMTLDERNPALNVTILSGDINNDGSIDGNSYHVVTGACGLGGARFDGFTVTGGNADGTGTERLGGGMYNYNCFLLQVNNCTFSGNYTSLSNFACGGGMYNGGSSTVSSSYIIVTNCTFSNNKSYSGGGMYSTYSLIGAVNCTFSDNWADCYGGGVQNVNTADSVFANCTFSGNSNPAGGGVYFGGGMANIQAKITMANCTFSGNRADVGKGMYNNGLPSTPTAVTMTNCIFWDPYNNSREIYNSDSTADFTYCLVRGWDGGTGNINPDDPGLGPLADNGGPTKTHALLPGSPALNSGDPASTLTTDQRGMVRPQAGGFDMGAFELGTSAISGNAGIAGAVLSYTDGTAKTASADGSGNYSFSVSDNWSGTVIPLSVGYSFTPASRSYAHLVTNQINQNYTATPTTYNISGTIKLGGSPLSGVVLNGLPGTPTPTTDTLGQYSVNVGRSWSGTVTPVLTGYTFSPATQVYTIVVANQITDYAATPVNYTISGTVTDGTNPIQGVTITFSHNNQTVTTAANGTYSYAVPYQTTTTLTPSHPGYGGWTPASRAITTITANQPNQDFSATINHYTITATAGTGGAITPSGAVDVAYAGSQDFAISPDPHYRINDVLVDGTSVGAVSNYSFTNVESTHMIAASFAIIQYTVTASVDGGHGTASPALQSVNSGETALIRLVPETGYKLGYLSDNGSIVNPVSEYRIYDIGSDHLVVARFENGPPLVEITEPEDGALVTGVVEVKARIEDDGKIQGAELYVDGVRRQAAVAHKDVTDDPDTAAKAALEPATWQLSTTEMCLEFGPGPLLINSDNILWRLDESGAILPALAPVRKVSHVQRLLQTDALLFVFAEPCPDSAGARSWVHLLNRASGTLQALVPESFAAPLLLANNPVFQEDEQGGIWFVKSMQNGLQAELWRWNKQNGPERIGTVPFVPLSWQLLSTTEAMFQEGTLNGARRWLLRGNELRAVDDHAALLAGNRQVAGSAAVAAALPEDGFSARFGSRSFALSGNSVRVSDVQLGTIMEVSAGSWEPYQVSVAGGDSFLILGRDPLRKMTGLLRLGWDEAGARVQELAEFAADPAGAAELEAEAGSAAADSPRMRPIGMADSGEWTFVWDSGLDQAGTHTLRVVASDDAGATGMDEVRVNLAKIQLTLSALRKTVRSWSFVRYYGQIELAVASENSPSLRFRLMRRTGSGSYAQLQEFGENELQNGAWSFQDKYLEKDLLYTYVVEALDPSGRVLGRSSELTI